MGVLFCDTFIIVTFSVRLALDSFISFISCISRMCLSRCIFKLNISITLESFILCQKLALSLSHVLPIPFCATVSLNPRAQDRLLILLPNRHLHEPNLQLNTNRIFFKSQKGELTQIRPKFKINRHNTIEPRHCMFSSS